jgi:hypothetical protein
LPVSQQSYTAAKIVVHVKPPPFRPPIVNVIGVVVTHALLCAIAAVTTRDVLFLMFCTACGAALAALGLVLPRYSFRAGWYKEASESITAQMEEAMKATVMEGLTSMQKDFDARHMDLVRQHDRALAQIEQLKKSRDGTTG